MGGAGKKGLSGKAALQAAAAGEAQLGVSGWDDPAEAVQAEQASRRKKKKKGPE